MIYRAPNSELTESGRNILQGICGKVGEWTNEMGEWWETWVRWAAVTAAADDDSVWLVDRQVTKRPTSADQHECTKNRPHWHSDALHCPTHQTERFVDDFSSSRHWRGQPTHPLSSSVRHHRHTQLVDRSFITSLSTAIKRPARNVSS